MQSTLNFAQDPRGGLENAFERRLNALRYPDASSSGFSWLGVSGALELPSGAGAPIPKPPLMPRPRSLAPPMLALELFLRCARRLICLCGGSVNPLLRPSFSSFRARASSAFARSVSRKPPSPGERAFGEGVAGGRLRRDGGGGSNPSWTISCRIRARSLRSSSSSSSSPSSSLRAFSARTRGFIGAAWAEGDGVADVEREKLLKTDETDSHPNPPDLRGPEGVETAVPLADDGMAEGAVV